MHAPRAGAGASVCHVSRFTPWRVFAALADLALFAACERFARTSERTFRDSAPTQAAQDTEPATALSVPVSTDASTAAGVDPRPAELPRRIDGMLLVPGGTFMMGAENEGQLDERPAHPVTVRAFYLDETEVTNEAYLRCVAAGVCRAPDPRSAEANHVGPDARFRGPRQPVSSISWESARNYCAWIGKRLPTEAEWERAARGDDGRRYPWGNEPPTEDRAVFGHSVTQDVGTHPAGAGPYGHQDLAGNVWEWVEDIYDPIAYRRPTAAQGVPGTCEQTLAALAELRREHRQGFTGSNPIPTECERVLRGGAFNYDAFGLRATNRVHHPGRYRLVMSGFRCARDAR